MGLAWGINIFLNLLSERKAEAMYNILEGKYFPFGSQYYRAPSPHESDWEGDLKNMAALGFNFVKYWIQWRWNNPTEGNYYFDDIDRLMDLAHKYKLRVMLNTIFDVAPAWIYAKYPDASMITLGGKAVAPQTQPHRQIGGLGYCFNHDGVMKHFFEFLEAAVERYKDHPALEIWNVGSEPELTSSMAEMRLYADDAEKINDMLCYCGSCRRRFRLWLKDKYKNIEVLNQSWNRNYESFDQAEIPMTRNTLNDLLDWRNFFIYTLGENVGKRFETARKIDKGKHPLMCHHVFIQGFPVTSTASDPWNAGRFGELHGFTQMDDAMMIDILRSSAKDKPVISAEMLMLYGYTLDLPKRIDTNDIKRNIFSGIAGNIKGFVFWQYRPEILGREAPAWGLTNLDGSETPWLKAFSETGKVLQRNSGFLLSASPDPAEIAILYSPDIQIFAWASTGNEKNATNSLLGYHRALYENNYTVDFVHPIEIKENILQKYKVLIVPFPYCLSREVSEKMKDWVAGGGVLIGEAYFAGWNLESGHHEKVVPGYGFDKVFKCRQGVAEPVTADGKDGLKMIMKRGLKSTLPAGNAKCAVVRETLITDGAEVLAEFETGEAAVTVAEYKKGKAVLIGSYIGLASFADESRSNSDFIAGLIEYTSEVEKNALSGKGIRIDKLKNPAGKIMLILQNLTMEYKQERIEIDLLVNSELKEQFDGSSLKISAGKNNRANFSVRLEPKEVKVFCG